MGSQKQLAETLWNRSLTQILSALGIGVFGIRWYLLLVETLSREDIKKIIIDTLIPLGVVRISIFGSFARREDSSTSDVDILVKLPSAKNRPLIGMQWFTLDQELAKKIGRPVDLVSEDALFSPLRAIIERDLEVIYEKTG